MTEFQAATLPPGQTYGKGNMASAAFAELRAARIEGRAPEGSGLRFADIVDTLNPLQHVPVLSDIYRRLTGDTISPQARVAGGALYGGPLGGIASVLSLAITGDAEKGVGDRLLAGLLGESGAAPTRLAAADKAPAMPEAERRAAEKPLLTASLAPQKLAEPAPSDGNTSALPGLSPEAFEALIGSFTDPVDLGATATIAPETQAVQTAGGDAGLIAAMMRAIDKYEAMKAVSHTAQTDEPG